MTAPTGLPLPDPGALTWDQAAGRACVWCGQLLTTGTVRVGVVRDRLGVHVLDSEVWTGPCCAKVPTSGR
ncbi:hypothetical protein QEN61_gp28 [Streptomyces phage Eklok]|uniref:Uncharacterized protein n=1 Tax=Streptomyces phage Eklok TaxID=2743999 RepID=A0A7D5JTA5_9CAUD|nr:hypothetical protein QEN61_gp28 [Streptomyces phage Eklok]QLF83212.1 hypothetical protein SEA_EKLOK_28 [Streptomyces phage Eklok]